MAADEADYLDYRVNWRAGDARPGRHAAQHAGHGGNFRAFLPFWQLPDAARIDVRRSIMDPSGNLLVRQMQQRSAIDVVVAVDVSLSMAAHDEAGAFRDVARLAAAASRAALRSGDAFGLLAFDSHVRDELALRPSRTRAACRMAVQALSDAVFSSRPSGPSASGRSASGIAQLASRLPHRRCLLVLVSDFHLPPPELERALASLAAHDVAPIVLHGPGPKALPRIGILRLSDAETGAVRLLLMRPSLRRRWLDAEQNRRAQLGRLFDIYCRSPLHVSGRIDVSQVSRHLLRV